MAMDLGDVALPGGKADEGDADDVETALREAPEEIGLDPSLVNVVTVLQPFFTKVILFVVFFEFVIFFLFHSVDFSSNIGNCRMELRPSLLSMNPNSSIQPFHIALPWVEGERGNGGLPGGRSQDSLAKHFRSDTPSQLANSPKKAAVLVCIFEGDGGDLRVILTKRSSNLSTHSGEVALPGGKADEGDADDVETALREAREEIGLDPSLVNVVTVLDPFFTKNGLPVVPVIGVLSDKNAFTPALNAAEVEAIFDAPLEMFLKDENRKAEEKEWKGHKYLLHYFDFEAESNKFVIWALTAGILIETASLVYQRPPAFLEQRPKFWSGCADKQTAMP